MPLTADQRANQFFQKGQLDNAYASIGACFVATEYRPYPSGSVTLAPVVGDHFCVIDDMNGVEPVDGVRRLAGGVQPVPANEMARFVLAHADGRRSFPGDGAWLDMPGVTLAPGETLVFHWKFLSNERSPGNDYARFLTFPGGDPTGAFLEPALDVGSARQPLVEHAQVRQLPGDTLLDPRFFAASWRPAGGFQGRLRWLVANAHLRRTRPTDNRRFLFPSTLLLDGVEVIRL